MDLDKITTAAKDPNDHFHFGQQSLGFSVLDFWQWNQSDLIENRTRGILAEFIVKQGLGIHNPTRSEWDVFDFETADRLKIEVKSAAYIQAWRQRKLSLISFNIAPTYALLDDNAYALEPKRQADIYIFCLLHHQDQATINPLDLSQWTFYLVATATLNHCFPTQKTIGLNALTRIQHHRCDYAQLKAGLDLVKQDIIPQ
jgi:hypothetical protein